MKKAYSYIRYSSPQQAKGDSFRRQLAATQSFCEKNGYELDTELSVYQELGISGFKGDQENLKRFIDDCEKGNVKKGSLLIVENLDRLSRQKINIAMRQFLHLLEYVDIYTLQDNKKYSHADDDATGDNQLLDIMTSLIIMSRAYEESATKQKRLKESWTERRKNIHTKKLTSIVPHWLELSEDKTTFNIKKDRVEIIKFIYEKCIEGVGVSHLLRILNSNLEQFPVPSKKGKLWARTSLSRILIDKSVLGEYQPHIGTHNGIGDNKRKPIGEIIPDYYPQIIDEDIYLKAQIARKSRYVGKGKIGKDIFSNLFRNLIKCAYCNGAMEYVNKGNNPSRGGKYLTCSNSKRGGKCSHSKHYKYSALELMLLHLTTENGLMPKPEVPTSLNLKLIKLQELHDKTNSKLNILLEDDFTVPAIKNKINELSREIEQYSSEIEIIEDQLLTYRPDYKYDDLFNDVILENDKLKLYANRINFNSYLTKQIDEIHILYKYCPFLVFTMKDKTIHRVIIDDKYGFGGCSISNGHYSYKRINEKDNSIDEITWSVLGLFSSLVLKILEDNNENLPLDAEMKKLTKSISKFIIDKDESQIYQILQDIQIAEEYFEQQKSLNM